MLTVDKGIRGYIAPEFFADLDDKYSFKEGDKIRLCARVEAYPTVGVTWHRDGLRLRPNRRTVATLDNSGNVELIICDAVRRDAGVYTCVASNAVGRTECSCHVEIMETVDRSTVPRLIDPNAP